MDAARALLKSKDIPVPEPPSLSFECGSEEDDAAALDAFVASVANPEMALITSLLTVERGRQLVGSSSDGYAFDLEKQLLARLQKKAELLLTTYTGQHEKLQAVTAAVLKIAYWMQLLGMDTGSLFGKLTPLWESAIDALLEDVEQKHDYRKAEAVLRVARSAALLGAADTGDKTIERLEAALTFDFEGKVTQHWPQGNIKLSASFSLKFHATDSTEDFITGEGQGQYDSYEDTEGLSPADAWKMDGQPFTVTATLRNVDFCAGTGKLNLDRFSAPTETWTVQSAGHSETLPMGKTGFETSFADYQDGEVFVFPVTLSNLDAEMVSQTISGPAANISAELEVKLTHKPGAAK